MIKLLLLGIGFMLIFEGLLYFFLANRIKYFLEQMKLFDTQIIKTISLIAIGIGSGLIYIILRFYS